MTYEVAIHTGPHPTDEIVWCKPSHGSIDQVLEGARVKCGQLLSTRGKRVFVEITDEHGTPITSRIFQEGQQP